ncbi:Assembly factor cbp4 [Elasticomyces elasticus]|nr:Assembly factor cbp4 [Elasticomyces elasticus]KAK3653832.1 Assembly factor cbp4 [Elasticomyces elasticus]KAK4916034.1 Assembly factor cbp4 [Elasticomyces elasticus]KAK5755416.1 Assembly factor cbp4 [Elasticomyces elasticus]
MRRHVAGPLQDEGVALTLNVASSNTRQRTRTLDDLTLRIKQEQSLTRLVRPQKASASILISESAIRHHENDYLGEDGGCNLQKYNPELQKRSLERRKEKQEDFDYFVGRLKEYSKSDKPIWAVWEQDVERKKQLGIQQELDRRRDEAAEAEARKQEMRSSLR